MLSSHSRKWKIYLYHLTQSLLAKAWEIRVGTNGEFFTNLKNNFYEAIFLIFTLLNEFVMILSLELSLSKPT